MPLTLSQRLLAAAHHANSIVGDGPVAPYQTANPNAPPDSRCVGYVTPPVGREANLARTHAAFVATIAEGIVVSLRGTVPYDPQAGPTVQFVADWFNDAAAFLLPTPPPLAVRFPGRVHTGFYAAFCDVWSELAHVIDDVVRANPGLRRIYVTGHSKGGAMCPLMAWTLRYRFPRHHIVVRSFAAARIGNRTFARAYRRAITHHVRYEYGIDVVPHLPVRTALAGTLGVSADFAAALTQLDPGYDDVGSLLYVRDDAAGVARFVPVTPDLHQQRVDAIRPVLQARDFAAVERAHAITTGTGYARAPYYALAGDLPEGWADPPPG
jgi:hypothetical protein